MASPCYQYGTRDILKKLPAAGDNADMIIVYLLQAIWNKRQCKRDRVAEGDSNQAV